MSTDGKQWIVKDDEGRIYGPFATEKVLEQIDLGFFVGGELIATYPGGNWVAISKSPEFYDRLLDVLAAEAVEPNNKSKSRSAEKKTKASQGSLSNANTGEEKAALKNSSVHRMTTPPASRATPTQEKKAKEESIPIIELTDIKTFKKKEKIKSAQTPAILLVVAVLLVLVAITLRPNKPFNTRLRLLAPRKGQPELSVDRVKEKFTRAISFFQLDTFTGYLKAQNELVQIVEGAPKNTEAMSTLCLTYREIWPYTQQDSEDARVMDHLVQTVKRIDPAGFDGAICEIAQRMVGGRLHEAENLIDQWAQNMSSAAVLMELKGDIYFQDKNFSFATVYFEKAHTLWPAWLKGSAQQARSLIQEKKFPQGLQLYRDILIINPVHNVAKVESALIELEQYKQFDKAYELTRKALDSGERLPRNVESNAHLILADVLNHRNQKKQALVSAKKAYALNPSNIRAHQLLVQLGGNADDVGGSGAVYVGDQLMKSGKYFDAQAQFKAAYDADPKNGMAALKAARCLWQLSQSTDAIIWAKKAIDADPKLLAAYIELANYYSQRYDFLQADRTLQRVQKIAPRSYEVIRGFATIEMTRNNYTGAIDYAQKALKLYEADVQTYIILAHAHAELKKFAAAERYIALALELENNNAEGQALKAKILTGLQGADTGIAYAKNLVRNFPQVIEYRQALGEIYFDEERYREAEDTLREVLSLDSRNKPAKLILGKSILKQEGRAQEALQIYLEAAAWDPSDAQAIFLAGMVYFQEKHFPDAITQFQRALKINEHFPRAHYQLGRCALAMGKIDDALREGEAERMINPELADAYLLEAEAYYAHQEYSNCLTQYQKAVQKRASGSELYVKMSRCARLTGAVDSAVSLLRQAASVESGNPNIYKEQGAVYQMKGMAKEALTAYDQYLALVPNAVDKAEVQAQMRQIESGQ